MKTFFICVILSILAANMERISAAKLVVIQDESASKSEEESQEKVNSEESHELDLLLDLIQKESRNRKPPPVKTVKVIRRKPEIVTQQSTRQEKLQKPLLAKEYHVHYHNHQHKIPDPPSIKYEEDRTRPVLLDSLSSHLNTFQDYYSLTKTPRVSLMSPLDFDRFKKFKDFEEFLEAKVRPSDKYTFLGHNMELPEELDADLPPPPPMMKQTNEANLALLRKYQEMAAIHQPPPPPPVKKQMKEANLALLKKYQALLNSKYRPEPPQAPKPRIPSHDFLNKERFAGFTDFSTMENVQHRTKSAEVEEPNPPKSSEQEEDLSIRDFAIVIKSKPRTAPVRPDVPVHEHQYRKEPVYEPPRPRIPQENHYVHERPHYRLPRILEAPGGTPQFIENMNKMRFNANNRNIHIASRQNLQQNLNSIESQPRQLFRVRPLQRPDLDSHMYNGWIIQRLMR